MKIQFSEKNYDPETPIRLVKAGHEVNIPKEEVKNIHEYDRVSLINDLKHFRPDVLVCGLKFEIDQEIIDAGEVKAVFTRTTGTDHIDADVKIINLKGEELTEVKAVPEITLGMMIYLMRTLESPGEELNGKNLAIIGLGRIGKMVAQLGIGLGMQVAWNDPNDKDSVPLDKLLPWCHVVSIHASSVEENRGMIGINEFKMMTKRPYLLNSARLWLVHNLMQALDKELISGAWFDFPLDFTHPKLITTNHIGGDTYDAHIKTEKIIVNKIIEYGSNNR